jgi:hypothetical protein
LYVSSSVAHDDASRARVCRRSADALAALAEGLGCPSWGGWVNQVCQLTDVETSKDATFMICGSWCRSRMWLISPYLHNKLQALLKLLGFRIVGSAGGTAAPVPCYALHERGQVAHGAAAVCRRIYRYISTVCPHSCIYHISAQHPGDKWLNIAHNARYISLCLHRLPAQLGESRIAGYTTICESNRSPVTRWLHDVTDRRLHDDPAAG